MQRRTVTLKAHLGRGIFYWVAQVEANSEEEAVTAAEHLFSAEMETQSSWEFDEYEVV